ncbi:unnamed protein product [Rotaria sordida]|uniref:G-protein coupled receptors family 1 profile domain-containing protein n=2 Tax=Rotaria sordida TaxID=392033 RepID=A0A814G2F1_9BILA|nr:unnamed protein product [Rotaria sordida]CAF4083641.1 unnamed protein product [Rotaria sordida]
MSTDIFTLSWFMVFALIMLIALVANIIIILAILRDKSMHTSTYFYIINVNIADILLVLSCLPERLAEAFGSNHGFNLGMLTCYLLPFLQQVSMHAALAFLLVLTIHRCYPAGVPRFLQGDFIRRQIRNHSQTLCILWAFAILINLPLFSITKYEKTFLNLTLIKENDTNLTYSIVEPSCFTGATEIWSRTYLILLLVFTYLITGVFLIVIYGQVIRIILASEKVVKNPIVKSPNSSDQYRFVPSDKIKEQYRSKLLIPTIGRGDGEKLRTYSASSSSASESSRRHQQNSPKVPLVICTPVGQNDSHRSSTNSHSTQHIQVIIMLFIVIILYILLLLPYRLLNLLYIVHNKIFQQTIMNEILFECLLNSVRLLVFLNCALQPIIYIIISSRLRQTVIKLLRSWYKCYCYCHVSSLSSSHTEQHNRHDAQAIRIHVTKIYQNPNRYQNQQKQNIYRDNRPIQTSLNNTHVLSGHGLPLNHLSQRQFQPFSHTNNKARFTISFTNRRQQ